MTVVRYPMPPVLAAMDVHGHHAVDASAGTGKTYLIERRVVDLVLRGGATIDEILLVTFTEKATAELRRRVRALLRELATLVEDRAAPGEPAWVLDGAARGQLRAALAGFDQAAIHTIHGFCHRVLIDSAFDGARRFRETRIGSETALREALSDALRDRLAGSEEDGPLLEAWFGQKRTVDQLAGRLSEIARLRGRFVQRYQPDEIARRLAALAGADQEAISVALKRAKVNAQTARAVVTRVGTLADLAARAGGGLPPLLDELAAASGSLREYLERPQLAAVVPDLADAVRTLDEAAVPLEAAIATRFLPVVGERLAVNKAERGQLDFGDMLEQVWRALDGPGGAELAARLRRRHPHALIDEFQDTDELQWSIFRRIYLEAPPGEAHLTVVGDPKQAIYGFRGADLATYLAARGEVLAGREPVRLEVCYRSSERLIAGVDGILGGNEPFFSGGIEYRPVAAAPSNRAADEAPLRLFDLGGFDRAEARRAALAARISREISQLIAGGTRPEQIFVLTRTVKESRQMAERLRADGVRAALYQQEGLLQTAEAAEVRDLFAAIAAPRDRSARLRAWQTRFFAVGLGELEAVADAGDGHPLVERLFGWRELADRLDYERLLPRILRESRLCERQLVLATGERALTNFLHLFEIILDEMLVARCDVAELTRRVGRWIIDTEDSEERNVQRLESERDAVQIMTVHRAKGLEAEVVFLYGGDGPPRPGGARVYHVGGEAHGVTPRDGVSRSGGDRSGGERRLFVGSPVPAAIKDAAAAEERGETERLLYVALTRAARRLYLPCWPSDSGGKLMADLVNARVQHWLASGGAPGVVAVERVAAPEERGPAEAARARALAAWTAPPLSEPSLDPAVARALMVQRGPVSTSYTRLKQAEGASLRGEEIDEEDDEAATPLFEVDRAAPADGIPRGRRVGIFLHEVLELLPLASIGEAADLATWSALPAVDRAIRTAARRHDLDPEQPAWRRMLWDALVRPIELGGGEVVPGVGRAARHCREVEFVFPLAGADGRERALVRGAIDLVFEHGGRVFWLDWKSDALADFAPDAVARHVRAEYALQADIYSLALARMLGIAGQADHEARFGGLIYLFLRGTAAHVERPTHADLVRIERELGGREVLG